MNIVKATIEDDLVLTAITKRSKSTWGYTEEQLLEWNDSLTVTKEYIQTYDVFKLVSENEIIGYYSYGYESEGVVLLDNLFILPEYMGTGLGKMLMLDFLESIRKYGIPRIRLYSDPNAEQFYTKFGFRTVGKLETKIENRFLPIMELKFNL